MTLAVLLLALAVLLTVWLMGAKPYGWVQDFLLLLLTATVCAAITSALLYALTKGTT